MITSNHEIIRVEKTAGNFAVMHKGFLTDDRLSFKAKGVLAYCLSKHDSWKVIAGDLVKQSTDGKAAVMMALRELKLCGYYEKSPVRDAAGRIVCWESVVREVPIDTDNVDNHVDNLDIHVDNSDNTVDNYVDNLPQTDFQHQENQETDKPLLDKPVLENRGRNNRDENRVIGRWQEHVQTSAAAATAAAPLNKGGKMRLRGKPAMTVLYATYCQIGMHCCAQAAASPIRVTQATSTCNGGSWPPHLANTVIALTTNGIRWQHGGRGPPLQGVFVSLICLCFIGFTQAGASPHPTRLSSLKPTSPASRPCTQSPRYPALCDSR